GGNHHQLLGLGGFGPSEHGDAQKTVAARRVFGGEPASQRGTDSAVREVNAAGFHGVSDAVVSENNLFECLIVGDHRHDDFGVATGAGGGIGHRDSGAGERIRFFAVPIVDCHGVPRAN